MVGMIETNKPLSIGMKNGFFCWVLAWERHGVVYASRRTRTYNPLIKSQLTSGRNSFRGQVKGEQEVSLSLSLPYSSGETAPDLSAVVEAWPFLPEPLKAGIVAMVKAASGKGGGR